MSKTKKLKARIKELENKIDFLENEGIDLASDNLELFMYADGLKHTIAEQAKIIKAYLGITGVEIEVKPVKELQKIIGEKQCEV